MAIFAKLFECILSKVIYFYVSSQIIPEQNQFIPGRSTITTTNLCEFTPFLSTALDQRLQVDVVYTDLTKIFDRVYHCILLNNLKCSGFCNRV